VLREYIHGDKQQVYSQKRRHHWDKVAQTPIDSSGRRYYHALLQNIYRNLTAENIRVLELGCGTGDLLSALNPSHGVGIDFSSEMIKLASKKYPHLSFIEADAHTVELDEIFDVIILSDLLNDLWDAQRVFKNLWSWCHPGTRVIINVWSKLWQFPLSVARNAGLAQPLLEQNWFAPHDVVNLLNLEGYECIKHFGDILLPAEIPLLAYWCNRYLGKLPLLNSLCLTHVFTARPIFDTPRDEEEPMVSVVVPARNEAGHINEIISQTPEMGKCTELILVEGNSTDDTWEVIQREVAKWPGRRIKTLRQTGKGKGDAVRCGFSSADGDFFMILDADMTVPPQDLPLFFDALRSKRCEFVNGVRLVYPMEKEAMRYWNLLANKGFSIIFSWLLGQSIKDTLCGTKALSRANYDKIASNREFFGDFDPFGDFDLIFGAAKQNLKIMDLPIRYRERVYGETNINRWRHGVMLFRMMLIAAKRIKFV
jgi:SAM-dependent methyltransferase